MKVKLGQSVKDLITGFEGVVTGRCEYITGCHQALVQPQVDKDNKYVDPHWFDEDRLKDTGKELISFKFDSPGCDVPAPIR